MSKPWLILCLLFGLNLMNFFDRSVASAVIEPIRKEFGLNDTQIGWLGTAFTLIYAAAGLPLGRMSDRGNRKMLLAAGAAFWSLMTATSGLAVGFWSLFITRIGVGIGEAVCAPAANSLVGDLYPASHRGRAVALFMLGLPIGIFLSFLTTGPLAHAFGWRVPFYIACLPGLILAGLILCIREPDRGAAERVATPQRPRSPYVEVLRTPAMGWIIASGALFNFNAYAAASFMTAFLMRGHGLNLKQANQIAAIVLGAVTAVGMLAGGWAADRTHQWRRNGRLLLSGSALLGMSAFTFLALRQAPGATTAFMTLMGAGMLLAYFYYAPVYATLQDLFRPQLRGTAMAVYFFGMYVLGASFGPVGTGALSDFFARRAMAAAGASAMTEAFRAAGLHTAMFVIPILALLAAMTLFAAAASIQRLHKVAHLAHAE